MAAICGPALAWDVDIWILHLGRLDGLPRGVNNPRHVLEVTGAVAEHFHRKPYPQPDLDRRFRANALRRHPGLALDADTPAQPPKAAETGRHFVVPRARRHKSHPSTSSNAASATTGTSACPPSSASSWRVPSVSGGVDLRPRPAAAPVPTSATYMWNDPKDQSLETTTRDLGRELE